MQTKFKRVFSERVASLLHDGYLVRVYHDSDSLLIVRLVHRSNGREVVVRGYTQACRIVQLSNGKVVYDGKVC